MTNEEKLTFCQDFHWEYFVRRLEKRASELPREEVLRAMDEYAKAYMEKFGKDRFTQDDYYVQVGSEKLKPLEIWFRLEELYEEKAKSGQLVGGS